jgi:cytosine/adenosine deaminase-related metal-dependent hydrolase
MSALVLVPEYLLTHAAAEPTRDMAVLVDGNRIKAIDRADVLTQNGDAERIDLPGCMLMPGFANAHQHGRGISQIQLGFPDGMLELWMAQRRARSVPDIRAIGLLACAEMLRNGVTSAVHADLAYNTGDYENELRSAAAAYEEAGLRANIAVGVYDQGAIVYPQAMESYFLAGLPEHLRARLTRPGPPSYAKDWPSTSALMDCLQDTYSGNERVRFCYGPSGPHWVSETLFREVSRDAEKRGVELHIHAAETVAQYEACCRIFPRGTMRQLREFGAIGPRTVIAHGVFLTDDDLDVLAEEGAMIASNPGSNLRLCDGTARLPEILDRGIRIGIGSDNSAVMDDEDLLSEVRVAMLLKGRRNWKTPPRPSAPAMIKMLTEDGAYASGFGGRAGRIEVGWLADLTAVSLDRVRGAYLDPDMPLTEAFMARGRGDDVRMTMVGGRILYRDGKLLYLDIDAIARQAGAAAEAARLPADPADVAITAELRPYIAKFYAELTEHSRFPDALS